MRNIIILFILFTQLLLAQNPTHVTEIDIQNNEGLMPCTKLDFNDGPGEFQFAIMSDRTGGHRPTVFSEAINKLNMLQPEFVMSVGDLIEGYTEDLYELNAQWREFDGIVEKLQMPFFYVPGNHDITNKVMEDLWMERLGRTFYHFIYRDVLFMVLNTEDQRKGAGRGTISDLQYQIIENTLKENQAVKWTFVFMHQPLWHQKEPSRWKDVETLLRERKHTVFSGHEHAYVKEDRNGGEYFTLATTGGVSSLRGSEFGEFDHIVWVSMSENGPEFANLMLEGIRDEDIVTKKEKDWLNEITRKEPFQIEPVILKDDYFVIGGAKIKITNDRNEKMLVRFEEQHSQDLIGSIEQYSLEVQPESVEEIKYSLRSRNMKMDQPYHFTAYVSYESDDKAHQMEIPFEYNLKPVRERILKRTFNKHLVDGIEDDWTEFPFQFKAAEDFEASFNLLYDDEYLYMALKVKDSDIYSLGTGSSWLQDNAGFGFSADPLNISVMNRGRGYYKNAFYQLITPENEDIKSIVYRKMPEGGELKCVQKEYGYFAEFSIPISYIEERQGKDWMAIRVGMAIDDVDNGVRKRHWWLPNWRDANNNYVGSGLFFRK